MPAAIPCNLQRPQRPSPWRDYAPGIHQKLLSPMNILMRHEILLVIKFSPTLNTFIWETATMYKYVSFKVGLLEKQLVTILKKICVALLWCAPTREFHDHF